MSRQSSNVLFNFLSVKVCSTLISHNALISWTCCNPCLAGQSNWNWYSWKQTHFKTSGNFCYRKSTIGTTIASIICLNRRYYIQKKKTNRKVPADYFFMIISFVFASIHFLVEKLLYYHPLIEEIAPIDPVLCNSLQWIVYIYQY